MPSCRLTIVADKGLWMLPWKHPSKWPAKFRPKLSWLVAVTSGFIHCLVYRREQRGNCRGTYWSSSHPALG